jgi:PAS domain S-box-containing protein
MAESDGEDLSWLDEGVRKSALEMLEVLFASSRVSVITFDADGVIVGVNPHMLAFDGRLESPYRGVNLLTNLILRRIGWGDAIQRVLAGETVEHSDTRWVTIFSGEERWVDVIAGPVMVDGKVIGGIAYLIDRTEKHRIERVASANRRRAHELEEFLANDVARRIERLERWARTPPPAAGSPMPTIEELSAVLDDLQSFIQLGTYQAQVERVLLTDAAHDLHCPHAEVLDTGGIAVMADRRLLGRVLHNLDRFADRHPAGAWSISRCDGRVVIEIPVGGSAGWLERLLVPTRRATVEAESADDSLAAARWMAEALNGELIVSQARQALLLNLPAADPQLA